MDVHFLAATAAYALAAILTIYRELRASQPPGGVVCALVAAGWLIQLIPMARGVLAGRGQWEVDLAASLEWSTLVMGLLFLAGWIVRRQETRVAAVLLLPLMVMSMGASLFLSNADHTMRGISDPLLIAHLVLSLLAYGLFTIAAVFAFMDALQEYSLKSKRLSQLFMLLPPLNALEATLFLMVRMGFALLTLSIVTGSFFSHQQSGVYLALTHKVLITWATWGVFGVLLLGHHFYGWRGRRAARFTLWGYLLLMLAFLGVKFVKEILLHRV
ncbi:MAG: cytochrome c biogenesis protein CcsA [Magnetococcales bacterium]|nr:cytochrome c biogenesis protein CcsA [Magnetococcales bacterium]